MSRRAKGEEAKREVLTLRVTSRLRDRLAAYAARSGRSIAQEVEHRLERMFYDEEMRQLGPSGRAYIELLASALGAIQARTGKEFDEDFATWNAFRAAVDVVTEDFNPGFDEAAREALDRAGAMIAAAGAKVSAVAARLCEVADLPSHFSAERALAHLLMGPEAEADELSEAKLGLDNAETFDLRKLDVLDERFRGVALSVVLALRDRQAAVARAVEEPDASNVLMQMNNANSAATEVIQRHRRLLPPKRRSHS